MFRVTIPITDARNRLCFVIIFTFDVAAKKIPFDNHEQDYSGCQRKRTKINEEAFQKKMMCISRNMFAIKNVN